VTKKGQCHFIGFSSTAVSTSVHFTSHTISQQPTKHNPKRQITITTLADENYEDKDDDDDDTTGHKVQNK
jgi:hypothetical protein